MARAKKLQGDESIECDAIRYGQRPDVAGWFLGVTILCWVIGGLLAFGGLLGGQLHLLFALLPAIFLQAVAQLLKRHEDAGAGELSTDGQTLYLHGDRRELRVEHARLRWGAADGTKVELETREGRRILLVLRRRKDVARLLDATGTSVHQRAMVLPLRAMIGPFVTGLLAFMALTPLVALLAVTSAHALGASNDAKALLLLVIPTVGLALSLGFVRRFARPTMTIGIDGILVRRRLRRTFIPYASIESVELTGAPRVEEVSPHGPIPTLRLKLHDDELRLPIVGWSDEDVRRAIGRIDEARTAPREDAVAPAAALARKGDSIDAWRQRLRRLLSADPGFRQRRLTLDEVLDILSDPHVPLDRRVGAALAVRTVEPDSADERIRFAADAAADHRVRVALLATLDDDDRATEAALAQAEQSEIASANAAANRRRARG